MEFEISDKVKRISVLVARILVGLVFIFSGYVKAVDPFGSTYKIEDYLTAMGLEMFHPIAFVAAVLLAAYEFLVGVCLLLGANMKTTSILALLMMTFMTPLTLWIAIADPVTDCGCFGDALVIGNWETFWKNIVITALLIVVFVWRNHSPKLFSQRTEWIISICAGFYSILLSLYCYLNLPIIDFRPYKNGANIPASMEIPEGAPETIYETKLIYEKNGKEKEFSLSDYPKDDPSWKFVDQKNKLVQKGYEPPIHDFTMDHPDDGDITEDVMADTSYTFLLVSYDIEKAKTNKRKEINAIYEYAQKNGYGFYGMTTTGLDTKEMREYKIECGGVEYPFVNTDEKQLKTMVRSNPGLVLIKNGVVVNKWSNKNMPTFTEPLENSPRGQVQKPNDSRVVFLSTLSFLGVLLCVFAFDKIVSAIADRLKKKED